MQENRPTYRNAPFISTRFIDSRTSRCSPRLVSSPAVVTSVLTPHMRKMMRQMMAGQGGGSDNTPMTLEVSAKHPVIKTIFALKDSDQKDVAKMSCEWLLDNASIAAGMLDEPRQVLPRQNKLLEMFVMQAAGFDYGKKEYGTGGAGGADDSAATPAPTEEEGKGDRKNTNTKDDAKDDDDAPRNPMSEGGSSLGQNGAGGEGASDPRLTEIKKEAKM